MRKIFEMSEAQLAALYEAIKPAPAMFLSGGQPMFRSQQERANDAWAALGKELGFDPMSVHPDGRGDRFFTADEVAK
jgi:predicted TIM-barrel fold metal-dependent hydrolase